jgi:hypothetical protein
MIKIDCEINGAVEWEDDCLSIEEAEKVLSSFVNNTLFDVDFRAWSSVSEKEYRIVWTAKIVEE